MASWLGLHASIARGMGSIPAGGNLDPTCHVEGPKNQNTKPSAFRVLPQGESNVP